MLSCSLTYEELQLTPLLSLLFLLLQLHTFSCIRLPSPSNCSNNPWQTLKPELLLGAPIVLESEQGSDNDGGRAAVMQERTRTVAFFSSSDNLH